MHSMNCDAGQKVHLLNVIASTMCVAVSRHSVAPTTGMVPCMIRTSNFMAVTEGKMKAPNKAVFKEYATHNIL